MSAGRAIRIERPRLHRPLVLNQACAVVLPLDRHCVAEGLDTLSPCPPVSSPDKTRSSSVLPPLDQIVWTLVQSPGGLGATEYGVTQEVHWRKT